jgi:aminoglycoside 3-N-acetyltransferase
MAFGYQDLLRAYQNVGVGGQKVIILHADLRFLGSYETMVGETYLQDHLRALKELIGDGTLVVPTASLSLCNTDQAFDIDRTVSETGSLSEFIRKQTKAVRSFHPFVSFTALGSEAGEICSEVSRHAFGPETPTARMLERDALCVSVGLHPEQAPQSVHHIEMAMGVPYRYTKEFVHPVTRNGQVKDEAFYMYVLYNQCEIKRAKNKKLMRHFRDTGHEIVEADLGKGKIYSYSLLDFYNSTVSLLKNDIFAWVETIPEVKPYRETR